MKAVSAARQVFTNIVSGVSAIRLFAILSCLFALTACGPKQPYDKTADAKGEIQQALAGTNRPVLVVFGANWCPDCLMLDKAMTEGTSAPLLQRDFKIVKVDVGQKDKNLDLAASYGVYLSNGIPAVVILSPKNEVLYATRAGELSNARTMSDDGIYQFFKTVTAPAKQN